MPIPSFADAVLTSMFRLCQFDGVAYTPKCTDFGGRDVAGIFSTKLAERPFVGEMHNGNVKTIKNVNNVRFSNGFVDRFHHYFFWLCFRLSVDWENHFDLCNSVIDVVRGDHVRGLRVCFETHRCTSTSEKLKA